MFNYLVTYLKKNSLVYLLCSHNQDQVSGNPTRPTQNYPHGLFSFTVYNIGLSFILLIYRHLFYCVQIVLGYYILLNMYTHVATETVS